MAAFHLILAEWTPRGTFLWKLIYPDVQSVWTYPYIYTDTDGTWYS